ncbi:MAG: flagellar biosynthetic protein FliO [Rhodospirillales bacterium]
MNMDLGSYFYAFLALLFVLALIALMATLARRYGIGFPSGGKMGRGRRLAVVEVLALGPKHRLVLIRRDGAEHLLLLGAASETVVERDIRDGGFAAALQQAAGAGPSPEKHGGA